MVQSYFSGWVVWSGTYAAVVYIFVKKKRINFKNIPTKISHKLSLIESMKQLQTREFCGILSLLSLLLEAEIIYTGAMRNAVPPSVPKSNILKQSFASKMLWKRGKNYFIPLKTPTKYILQSLLSEWVKIHWTKQMAAVFEGIPVSLGIWVSCSLTLDTPHPRAFDTESPATHPWIPPAWWAACRC